MHPLPRLCAFVAGEYAHAKLRTRCLYAPPAHLLLWLASMHLLSYALSLWLRTRYAA